MSWFNRREQRDLIDHLKAMSVLKDRIIAQQEKTIAACHKVEELLKTLHVIELAEMETRSTANTALTDAADEVQS